jgi:hypothetical protein
MLHDLSGLPTWGKVNEELAKLYKVEVLSKLPVVQVSTSNGCLGVSRRRLQYTTCSTLFLVHFLLSLGVHQGHRYLLKSCFMPLLWVHQIFGAQPQRKRLQPK